jgi:hypothetical protein
MQAIKKPFLQISPLGSKDPSNRSVLSSYSEYMKNNGNTLVTADLAVRPDGTQGPSQSLDLNTGVQTNFMADWDESPNHPIIQNFQNLFSVPGLKDKIDDPEVQNFLFDFDNTIKGSAGVFREPQQGISDFGADVDGKPLYTFDDMRNSNDFELGKNRLYNFGSILQQLGAVDDDEDADRLAKFTNISSDPNFMGRIEGLQLQGDTKGAVNTILTELGQPALDNIGEASDPKRAYGLAFAAYNYAANSEKLSPSQKSLALSTMALSSYKFKDGSDLASRALIKDENGKTAFSVGDATALAGSGIDVFGLQKNWDQIDLVQRLTYGKGTASQMAATGQRIGLLGNPALGGASVALTDAELGQAGFTAVPSAGIGAITGDGQALPQGYEVIGAGQKPGQVIAVPKGLSYSSATINGANEIRSLNAADGVRKAGSGAFKVANGWLPTNSNTLNSRGTSFASGLGQSGVMQDPYLLSSMVTASVFGNTTRKQAKQEEGIKPGQAISAGRQIGSMLGGSGGGPGVLLSDGSIIAEGAAIPEGATAVGSAPLPGGAGAALPIAGVIGLADVIKNDRKGARGIIQGGASGAAAGSYFGPYGTAIGGAIGAGVGVYNTFSGGKSEEQQGRDQGRKLFEDITDGNWKVTLSDGSLADIGTDGKGGQHEFRFPDKDPNNVGRPLSAYDVDYTNDLDFSASMMTSALTRLVAGGKGTSIDQVAGQLANASLGKVGFGQDMTEENFAYVRDNVRGFFFKKGIQTKEDAYALMNQQFATGRISEVDQIAMQQGINMAFDEGAFDTANILMAGRQKGLEVAGELPKAPGPNFDIKRRTPLPVESTPMDSPLEQEAAEQKELTSVDFEFQFNAGTYGGNKNTDIFSKSIIRYQDQNRRTM